MTEIRDRPRADTTKPVVSPPKRTTTNSMTCKVVFSENEVLNSRGRSSEVKQVRKPLMRRLGKRVSWQISLK